MFVAESKRGTLYKLTYTERGNEYAKKNLFPSKRLIIYDLILVTL